MGFLGEAHIIICEVWRCCGEKPCSEPWAIEGGGGAGKGAREGGVRERRGSRAEGCGWKTVQVPGGDSWRCCGAQKRGRP